MFRSCALLLAALAASDPSPLNAQPLRGQSFESVITLPPLRDTLRLWHRYLTDSTVVLLMPREANPWLRRGYEFLVPIGRISNPVLLSAVVHHRDSLSLSCTASDYFSSGYRFLFCRDAGGFSFRSAEDFQIFRSGVERVCRVPVGSRDKPDRRIIKPVAGPSTCTYIYHRRVLATFPDSHYALP